MASSLAMATCGETRGRVMIMRTATNLYVRTDRKERLTLFRGLRCSLRPYGGGHADISGLSPGGSNLFGVAAMPCGTRVVAALRCHHSWIIAASVVTAC